MRIKFASIQNAGKFAYVYDSDSENWESRAPVSQCFKMYQTYNDGLTQHSGDWAITNEYVIDYLASLATYIISRQPDTRSEDDNGLLQRLTYELLRAPCVASIEFAASVIFKSSGEGSSYEKKTRYYSTSEKKITTTPSKCHDKRYSQVTASEDGSAGAIYRMLLPEYANDLERLTYAEAIREWCLAGGEKRPYIPLVAEFLEWYKDDPNRRQKAQDLRHALSACQSLARAYQLRCHAETDLSNIRQAPAETEASESAA